MQAYFAKQPILTNDNKTYAYELLYRHSPDFSGYNGEDGDVSTADVINNVFFGGEPEEMIEDRKAFINFTENLLLDGVAKLLPKDILVVEVLESVTDNEAVLASVRELKQLGYTIALDDYVYSDKTVELFPLADIVKIDFRVSKEEIETTAKYCRENKKIILAEKVETKYEVEYAISLGATLMQGYYFARPLMMSNNVESPMARTFFRIVQLLEDKEPDIEEIDRTISSDAAMTLKILRLVNLIRNDTSEPIKSVQHAIIMLGLDKMKEWVYLFGLQNLTRDCAPEMMRTTIFRAHFCAGIAALIPQAWIYEKEMYLMGLMSLISGGKSIDALPVSDNIKSGLRGEKGVFADVFVCARAYEAAHWKTTDAFRKRYNITETDFAQKIIECTRTTNEILEMSGIN